MTQPRVFLDADVLFTGVAGSTEFGASHVILWMGQFTLLDYLAYEQAVGEAERNLQNKSPNALPIFHAIVRQSVRVVPDPTRADLERYRGLADPRDLPILVAAIAQECRWLLTSNVRHYWPPPDLRFWCGAPAPSSRRCAIGWPISETQTCHPADRGVAASQ